MNPIDEKYNKNITSSFTSIKVKKLIKNVASSLDDLMLYEANIEIQYKKRRNQMKHLTQKKKKRKK